MIKNAPLYLETISLCPECAKDCPAYYEEKHDGVFLNVHCDEHGLSEERVECDSEFFKWGYEQKYKRPYEHLVIPITYRCNLKCKYCYTLSNSSLSLPEDRTTETLAEIVKNFDGSINFIGGEPTLRDDLMQLIRIAKAKDISRIVSISTNGQKLRDINFVKELKDSGLDYVFLSLNDIAYEESATVHQNKVEALKNCEKLNMPVWLSQTIDNLSQLDSTLNILSTYNKTIFQVTIRAVKPFGVLYPSEEVFVSDMVKYLSKENKYTKGTNPFNRYVHINRKKIKLCSWVNDMKRLDPIDFHYVISNNMLTTFHRGMKTDEVLIKRQNLFAV